MGLFIPGDKSPPPPIGNPHERDRFGLPLYVHAGEKGEERGERIGKIEALVGDVVEAVIRQVGREVARSLFRRKLRAPSIGRQPDAEENAQLLATYDRAVAGGVPVRNAARVAAEKMVTRKKGEDEDVESIATRIRRLVKERAREAVEERALRETGGASFLGTFLRVREFQINAYDRAVERGIPVQRAAHAAAEEIATRKGDVEAIASDIRKTVKERERLGALWAARGQN